MSRLDFTPVVILGAGRSGTNMLRDAMTGLEGFETWPCDEINPVWRHGNVLWPSDEIPADRAPAVRDYIRGAFGRIWRETGKPRFVVEKTCANTLRVPFVDAVIPEAKYIHIVRDGMDVVASAQKRWRGELEIAPAKYYGAKLKYAPWRDLPVYGWRFLRNRIAIARNHEQGMAIWGPRFEGMDALRESGAPLGEVCATQWAITADPVAALSRITEFLGASCPADDIARAVSHISAHPVGKGRAAPSADPGKLTEIMGPVLQRYGYGGGH